MSTTDFQARDSHCLTRRKRPPRRGFSLDMTPLVDVAFLLLTFFMFTTTMAQPQALEMRMPPGTILSVVEVPQSLLLSVFVRGDGHLFWRKGNDQLLHPITRSNVHDLLTGHYRTDGAIVQIKLDTAARYQKLIDLLDEIRFAARASARLEGNTYVDGEEKFSVDHMTPRDYTEVGTL